MLQRFGLTNNWQKMEYLLKYTNENFKRQLLQQPVARWQGKCSSRLIWSNNGMRNGIGATLRPFEPSGAGDGLAAPSSIIKAIAFTGAFSLASYFGATILEYENTRNMMLEKARQAKRLWIFRKAKEASYWQNLRLDIKRSWEKLKPGEKVFVPICAINVLVFAAWRVPSLKNHMTKYFCSNSAARVVCWPMFLSTFSHYSGLHLFANMYVLHSFANAAVVTLGKEQFLGFYLTAGVIASLTSILYKVATTQHGLSLGASGAIMAILAYVCTQYPETKLSILFLPGITFPAGSAIKVIMGLDLVGCALGWKFFDHAAHLGGALFGIFWTYYGTELWKKRLPFLSRYHDWRKSSIN